MPEFDAWAAYYDLVHQGLPGEAEFYVGQAIRKGGKTLELGCGTGRIALPMAMSGADVVGLDNSPGMLAVCREKLSEVGEAGSGLRLVEGDMAHFDLGETFDLVIVPYRGFMHLHRREQQRSCFDCVRAHLRPGGLFMFNTWVPSASVIASHPTSNGRGGEFSLADEYEGDGPGHRIRHYHRAEYDELRQRIVERHVFDHLDSEGRVTHTKELPMLRVWTTPREMENLAELCGFGVRALFGDFDCCPLNEASTEQIWVLETRD